MLIPPFSEALKYGKQLELRGWRLGVIGARRLAEDPILAGVQVIDLSGNQIGDEGLAALLASPHLEALTELRLAENNLTAAGIRTLAATAEVTELDLSGNALDAGALEALAPLVPSLELLDLAHNPIGDAGARALAAAGHRAEELSLSFTELGPEGLAALVDAGVLAQTHSLRLTGNPLGDAGADALARLATQTGGFSSVSLGWTGLSVRGLAALLDSGLFRRGISHLELRGNPLGEAGLRLLVEHPYPPDATLHIDDGPHALIETLRARRPVVVNTKLDEGRVLACPYCYEALDWLQPLCPHCRLDASRDAPTDEDERRHKAAERRPCPHCGGSMHARHAWRCPHCASWTVRADELERLSR